MSKAAEKQEESTLPVKTAEFVHLHCHSEYSSLDGGSRVAKMPDKLKELGMNAMALTDHGVMQGISEFYDTLKDEGIKPILGIEAYLTEDRHNKNTRETPTWHITLLAENNTGYQNLCKLSSWAFIDGTITTFGRPRARADWELMERYSEGVICLTGCMAGPVMNPIMIEGNLSLAKSRVEKMISIFGKENVYGEIQNVGIVTGVPGDSELAQKMGKTPLTEEEAKTFIGPHGDVVEDIQAGQVPVSQTDANAALVDICNELGLKYVATGDVHYLDADDADPHDTMICIGTGQIKKGPRRFSLLPKKYHMRSEDEMREAVSQWPEALATTLEVAERCNAEVVYGRELLPRFPIPDGHGASKEYLEELCRQGIDELYPQDSQYREAAEERLAMELGVISSMGFNDYFLIVWDLFREARRQNIPYGPGRGSAAGSIVAYALGITQMCPLEHDLLFERFLNPDRKSMPDIDMDFGVADGKDGMKKRDQLIQYSIDKYNTLAGCDTAVAQIVTFSKFKAKGALKDSARVLAEPTEDGKKEAMRTGDKLASYIPDDPKATMRSVWADKELGKQLRQAHKRGGLEAEIIQQAGWMEGLVRAYSTHAAAVLIADHDLTNDLPMQKLSKDKPLEVQYDMVISERLGLLKMDFLGLRNLDVIWDALEKIKHVRGITIENPYRDIPLDDKKTYDLFARGESIGTFQFECLAGDTIINGDQHQTIADLYAHPPRYLRSIDPSTGESRSNRVLKVVQSGEKQLYKLRAADGYILRASGDHKLLTSYGWKSLRDIDSSDSLIVNPSDASKIGACLDCGRQVRSRGSRCQDCASKVRNSGSTMSQNRDAETGETSFRQESDHHTLGTTMNHTGVDHKVRSEWEGRMACRLIECQEPYQYEPKTFSLADGRSYTPDFYLLERDTWIGLQASENLCEKDNQKVEAFLKEYPGKRLIIVGAREIDEFDPASTTPIRGADGASPVIPDGFAEVQVIEVVKDKVEMTYDIAMQAPLNNYIANGIVVHNSSGMQSALREVRTDNLNDLIALVALYRPGPMAHIPTYAARKQGRQPVEYLDPKAEPIQRDTYGITIYQEQSMLLARELAGFTPGEADDLRKAIGKKLRDKMDALKPKFLSGAKANGIPREVAEAVWADNEAAADYSFNKAHAACYAFLAYITGYLKANYPEEYMAALLSSVMGKKDKPRLYLTEAKRMGLIVLPPDINRSLKDFAVREREEEEGLDILFGLTAIKGVGNEIVEKIIEEREERGPFESLFDLIRRMPKLNKTVLGALIRAGALDSTGPSRRAMSEEVEIAIERIKKQKKAEEKAFNSSLVGYLEQHPREGDTVNGKGMRKLTSLEKKAVQGAGLYVLENGGTPDAAELFESVHAAISKETIRATRADLRKQLKEAGGSRQALAGIAQEENESASEKELVEAAADKQVEGRAAELKQIAEELSEQAATAVATVKEQAAGEEGFELAMEAEADPPLGAAEWEELERLNYERDKLGVYVTGHPLDRDKRKWAHYVDKGLGDINDHQIGKTLKVVGALVGSKPIKTRSGELMYKIQIEDLTGTQDVTIFSSTLDGGIEQMLEVGKVIAFDVTVKEDTFQKRDEQENADEDAEDTGKPIQLIASRVYNWDPSRLPAPKNKGKADDAQQVEPVNFTVPDGKLTPAFVQRLKAICDEHPGEHPLRLHLDGKAPMLTELKVKPTDAFLHDLEQISGSGTIPA